MSNPLTQVKASKDVKEVILERHPNGLLVLLLFILIYLLAIGGVIYGGTLLDEGSESMVPEISIEESNSYPKAALPASDVTEAEQSKSSANGLIFFIPSLAWVIGSWVLLGGFRLIRPEEAVVLTLFGRYLGTLRKEGFYYIHPFAVAFNPAAGTKLGQSEDVEGFGKKGATININSGNSNVTVGGKKISLKIMTLSNAKQKINDALGNPVEVGVAVTWRVVDTAKAVFVVDNYKEYLSLQCDIAVRDIVRIYPYDVAANVDTTGDGQPDEGSLRGSSKIVAERIRQNLQEAMEPAGIEICKTQITYLAYAPEIAAVMLKRQQASAIIDARAMIVQGAVSIVEMALDELDKNNKVSLDEERKAAMVSNLLVVLCADRDAQPIVNTGSLY